jgi:hypothetical protein
MNSIYFLEETMQVQSFWLERTPVLDDLQKLAIQEMVDVTGIEPAASRLQEFAARRIERGSTVAVWNLRLHRFTGVELDKRGRLA